LRWIKPGKDLRSCAALKESRWAGVFSSASQYCNASTAASIGVASSKYKVTIDVDGVSNGAEAQDH